LISTYLHNIFTNKNQIFLFLNLLNKNVNYLKTTNKISIKDKNKQNKNNDNANSHLFLKILNFLLSLVIFFSIHFQDTKETILILRHPTKEIKSNLAPQKLIWVLWA